MFFSACAIYEPIQIQVLKPSGIKIDDRIAKVVMINHSVFEKKENSPINVDSSRTSEYLHGLGGVLANSPLITTNPDFSFYNERRLNSRYEPLNWEMVSKICRDSSADAAVVLESYQITHNGNPPVKFSSTYGYYTQFIVENTSLWRIYYPAEKKIVLEYVHKDTLVWDASSYDQSELIYQLPEFESAMNQSCFYAGVRFGEYISPSWSTKTRYLITCEVPEFQYAVNYARDNNWDAAIEIWKKYPYTHKKRLAAMASYNLAIASETMDHLDIALEWASKSYLLKKNDYVRKYIELLEKRKSEKEKLFKDN